MDAIDRELQLRSAGNANDAESQRVRADLEKQRLAAIRSAIGADRFDTFAMLHDPVYQDALASAQKVGASQEAATALYEIQRATTDEVDRIQNDPNLTAGQKQEQLREAQAEQQRARALVLGEQLPAEPVQQQTGPELRSYRIIPGDTLGQIALRYGVGMNAVRAVNPGLDINRLPPGTVINVPTPTPRPPLPIPPGRPGR